MNFDQSTLAPAPTARVYTKCEAQALAALATAPGRSLWFMQVAAAASPSRPHGMAVVHRLIARGLLKRVPAPDDSRRTAVRLRA